MAQDHTRVIWLSAVRHRARYHRRRLRFIVAALVMLSAYLGLMRVRQHIMTADASLGADLMLAGSGVAAQRGDILLMDLPQNRTISQETFVAIRRTPGVALAVPLYNLGKLSAQECPA